MKMRGGLKTGSILYLSCLVLLQTGCAADLNGFQKSKTYELGQEPKVSDFTDGNGHFDLTFDGIGSYQTSIVEENGRKIPVTVIIRDTKAPEWDYFEETVTTEQGKKPSYHFSATDAGKVTIQIDDDQLDIQTPGEYECSVSAEDEAGNKIIRPFTVKVVPKNEMPKMVISHVSDAAQKTLADRIVEVLNSSSENRAVVVEEHLSEEDWNVIHHVDYAVCDTMGWEYMDITDGFANPDDTYQISINPAEIHQKARYRNLPDYRLQTISDNAGIRASDSAAVKAKKIRDLIVDRLQYTNEEIYPSQAVQIRRGNSMTYAMLFDELADYNGIPSDFITGYLNGDYHCWNRIWIDGQPKWIDLALEQAKPGSYFMSDTLWNSHELSLTEISSGQ